MTTTEPTTTVTPLAWLDLEALCPADVRRQIADLTERVARDGLDAEHNGQSNRQWAGYYFRAIGASIDEMALYVADVLGDERSDSIIDALWRIITRATGYENLFAAVDDANILDGGADAIIFEDDVKGHLR